MSSLEELARELSQWDGRSREAIEAVLTRRHSAPDLAELLVRLLDRGEYAVGVTWLLKRGLERELFAVAQVEAGVLRSLPSLQEDDARLHVLQLLHRFTISPDARAPVEHFVRAALESSHKFVRAWSYSGLHALAVQYPEYRAEATQLLEQAQHEGAASSRARARILLRQGFQPARG